MKLCGFSGLHLGAIDIKLTDIGQQLQQKLWVCSVCKWYCSNMNVVQCGHTFCDRCLFKWTTETDGKQESLALCLICWTTSCIIKVTNEDELIAELEGLCPMCTKTNKIKDLKDHVKNCKTDNEVVPQLTSEAPTTSKSLSRNSTSQTSDGDLEHVLASKKLQRPIQKNLDQNAVLFDTWRLVLVRHIKRGEYRTAKQTSGAIDFFFLAYRGKSDLFLLLKLRNKTGQENQARLFIKVSVTMEAKYIKIQKSTIINPIHAINKFAYHPFSIKNFFAKYTRRANKILEVSFENPYV
ncbi:uncharacterized protein LOC111248916 [Varroa destructor]|uniref:RING-type domain-containing protein n=1 Tax=Varroa destructor TaxID=109461 RepID=A0A7M7JVD2_VARDE|nr:uncharacterized protein LOC111248916 [Varroa destructor]XP_022657766.1 uncharacterized protein LOC111248916 [Varroa destructor]XP_022657767.1 uncharacterized protein LOC111248916 [Varroa destructor]XP_022657768.1 uncharacterized protein LOC111248916 [Varroa destructor]